jgi:hypothetical protein
MEEVHPFVRHLAHSFLAELDPFAGEVDTLLRERPWFDSLRDALGGDTRAEVKDQIGRVVRGIAGLEPMDVEPIGRLARTVARADVPAADLVDVLHQATALAWARFERYGAEQDFTNDDVLAGAAGLWALTDRYRAAITEGYDRAVADRDRDRARERAALVDALFDGRTAVDLTLGEAAHRLGFPDRPTLVAVVAEHPPGQEPAEHLESALSAERIHSVWQPAPAGLNGVVVIASGDGTVTDVPSETLDRQLQRHLPGRVGVSPPFAQITDVPVQLALADLARRCTPPGEHRVVHMEGEPVAALVVAAPGPARHLMDRVLAAVLALDDAERDAVLETLTAWMASAGSMAELARRLYCHRNTARNRLTRAEKVIGRSLADPRAAAEVVAALTAWHLEPDGLS